MPSSGIDWSWLPKISATVNKIRICILYWLLLSVAVIHVVLFSIHRIDSLWGDRHSVGFRAGLMKERQHQVIQVDDWSELLLKCYFPNFRPPRNPKSEWLGSSRLHEFKREIKRQVLLRQIVSVALGHDQLVTKLQTWKSLSGKITNWLLTNWTRH